MSRLITTRIGRLLAVLGLCLLPRAPVQALISSHGRERVVCDRWSPGLTAIINDPARVSGFVGPLAPAGRFCFSGDTEVFNRVLARYAELQQKQRVLYLEACSNLFGASQNGETCDFEMSITLDGDGFFHLYTGGRIRLEDLRIPKALTVESLPLMSVPIDPQERTGIEAEQKRIEQFVDRQRASLRASAQLTPGAMAPRIQALSADGNSVVTEHDAVFPSALLNLHVLVVFWSLSDKGDLGLINALKPLRLEFGKARFQIVSVCVDDDWENWIKFLDRQGRVEYRGKSVAFGDDSLWWQLAQAGSGVNCAAEFGVSATPAAFLIQPNGRLFSVQIPPEKLRATVVKALEWETN